MPSIITRAGKASELTHAELDTHATAAGQPTSAKSANFTITEADNRVVFECTTNITATLNAASTINTATDTSDFECMIINLGTELVQLTGTGSDTMDGVIFTNGNIFLYPGESRKIKLNNANTGFYTTESNSPKTQENAFINGAMLIGQRGTSFVSPTTNDYTLDRWIWQRTGTAAVTVTQDTTVPAATDSDIALTNSMKIDLTTADVTLGAGDFAIIGQRIEGYNIQQLRNTALTFSGWFNSTKTGTFCISLRNSGANRAYVHELTIDTANTWEFKSFIVDEVMPTAGTWDYTTGIGLNVTVCLGSGSTYTTTADTWQTGQYFATSNQTNFLDDAATNFYMTGLKVEPGRVATRYVEPTYQYVLAQCQRYYWRFTSVSGGDAFIGHSLITSDGNSNALLHHPVPMRATPTMSRLNAISIQSEAGATSTGADSFSNAGTYTYLYTKVLSFTPGFTTLMSFTSTGDYIDATAEL